MGDNLNTEVDVEPKTDFEPDVHKKPDITSKLMVENQNIMEDSLKIVGGDKVPMPLNEQTRSSHIEQAKEATAQKADTEAKLKT